MNKFKIGGYYKTFGYGSENKYQFIFKAREIKNEFLYYEIIKIYNYKEYISRRLNYFGLDSYYAKNSKFLGFDNKISRVLYGN